MSEVDVSVVCFIDTNIWLYAFIENAEIEKGSRAKALLQRIPAFSAGE